MGDEKPGRFGGRGCLKISCETSTATEPCKSPFDDPASRQELEAFDAGWPLDDLDVPRATFGECVEELFATIHAVGKDVLESGKAVSQALQQGDGAMNILNVCGMNVDSQEKTIGVGDDMPLAPIDALAGVKAGWATGLRRRRTLAVDDSRRRPRLAS